MARVSVDNSGELFGAKTSIADLAQYLPIARDKPSNALNVYEVFAAFEAEYKHELKEGASEMEYPTGCKFVFRDGSILHVAAWKACSEEQAESYWR